MARVLIVVGGEPVAQGRPKFSTKDGVFRTYDPPKSREYKHFVRLVAIRKMGRNKPLEGPLSLSVRVYRSIPTSWSQKKQREALEGVLLPVTKPDLENICKGATDALEGVVFRNDSQIVAHHEPFGKWYSNRPRIEIEVKEIEG